jgi:hypothetical protein
MTRKPARLSVNLKQVALIAGIAAVALFLFGYTSRLIRSSELRAEVALWEEEVRLAGQRLEDSRQRLAYVQSDQYVIDQAHTELGWTFPNEVAVWVLGEESVAADAPLGAGSEPAPNWELWRQRFLGSQATAQ